MDLHDSRRATADNVYENFDFSYVVKDASGWTAEGPVLEKVVFLEDPDGAGRPSIRGVMTIRFEHDSAVPVEAKAVVRGEEVGNITGGQLSDYVVSDAPAP